MRPARNAVVYKFAVFNASRTCGLESASTLVLSKVKGWCYMEDPTAPPGYGRGYQEQVTTPDVRRPEKKAENFSLVTTVSAVQVCRTTCCERAREIDCHVKSATVSRECTGEGTT